ncbi:MAG TPA: hypothetical protein VIM29_06465 [Bacillota bacterium]
MKLRRGLQGIVKTIDRRYLTKVNANPIPGSKLGLLLLCYHPYQAKLPLFLEEGTVISPGALIGEFHLSNIRITEIAQESSQRSLEWRLLQMLKQELTVLATACLNGEVREEVQAFSGTLVLVAGAKRLGFSVVPLSNGWNRWWLGIWESLLRSIYYSFQTKKKTARSWKLEPSAVWISRSELVRRYSQATVATENEKTR